MKISVETCKALAVIYHADQKYGDKPYMYHINSVHGRVCKMMEDKPSLYAGLNRDWVEMVAICHDLIEDTELTIALMQHYGFPNEVIHSVDCITKRKGELYLDYIERCRSDRMAKINKIADTSCNLEESVIAMNIPRIIKYSHQLIVLNCL